METDHIAASTTIDADPEAVFAVLTDPSAHADIDGTGWVRESLDGDRITAAGQVFQFPPFGPDHLDSSLEHLSELAVEKPR